MTVTSTDITAGPYTGNGTTDTYNYDWTIQSKDEVIVYETDDSGNVTTLTVDTNYTVNNIGESGGGTITRAAGNLPSGYTWYIVSNFEQTQDTSFSSQGEFDPGVHESAFDKLTYLVQQLQEIADRSLTLPQSTTGVSVTLPEPIAGYLVGWNDDATALATIASDASVIYVGPSAPDETVFVLWYDSTNEVLKYWTGSAWQAASGTDISGKADRDTDAVAGNLAEFDANGHPVDSGIDSSVVVVDSDLTAYAQLASANFTALQVGGEDVLTTSDQVSGKTIFPDVSTSVSTTLPSGTVPSLSEAISATKTIVIPTRGVGTLWISDLFLEATTSNAVTGPRFTIEVDGTWYDLEGEDVDLRETGITVTSATDPARAQGLIGPDLIGADNIEVHDLYVGVIAWTVLNKLDSMPSGSRTVRFGIYTPDTADPGVIRFDLGTPKVELMI